MKKEIINEKAYINKIASDIHCEIRIPFGVQIVLYKLQKLIP